MAGGSPVNPYPTYDFLVRWDGRIVAAVSRVTGLSRGARPTDFRDGPPEETSKILGRTEVPVRLEDGIATDPEFERWVNATSRSELQVELYDDARVLVCRFSLRNCWVSEYLAGPDPGTFASMTIEHEAFELDTGNLETS